MILEASQDGGSGGVEGQGRRWDEWETERGGGGTDGGPHDDTVSNEYDLGRGIKRAVGRLKCPPFRPRWSVCSFPVMQIYLPARNSNLRRPMSPQRLEKARPTL